MQTIMQKAALDNLDDLIAEFQMEEQSEDESVSEYEECEEQSPYDRLRGEVVKQEQNTKTESAHQF